MACLASLIVTFSVDFREARTRDFSTVEVPGSRLRAGEAADERAVVAGGRMERKAAGSSPASRRSAASWALMSAPVPEELVFCSGSVMAGLLVDSPAKTLVDAELS